MSNKAKETTTMKYSKPELKTLVSAIKTIQSRRQFKNLLTCPDWKQGGFPNGTMAAHEADE